MSLPWSLGQEDPTEKEWQPTPVFSPDSPVDSGAGVLQSMSLQKSWHDLATEQQQSGWEYLQLMCSSFYLIFFPTWENINVTFFKDFLFDVKVGLLL